MTETPTRGIDPAGDVGLVLMALSQLGVARDYRERIETAVTTMQTRIADAEAEAATQRNAAGQANAALRRFKNAVRDLAILTHKNEDWCLDGLNAALESLGLAKYVPASEYEVTIRETAARTGTITVTVDRDQYPSDEAAEQAAKRLAEAKHSDESRDIDWGDWEDVEAKDIDEWDAEPVS
jgi:phosphoglycolate phosphatase-like HAD superfamily hydrolase